MKAQPRDGAVSQRAWKRTRHAKVAHILRTVPKAFSADLLTLTICRGYAESLLKNLRVERYLTRYHLPELRDLEILLEDLQRKE